MTYTKPEVAVLGEARRVIEKTGLKQVPSVLDVPFRKSISPGYDLDD